jgi:membrane dipeptidase
MPLYDWKLKFKPQVPEEVMALHRSCDVVDLHIDTFMIMKLRHMDITKRGKPVTYMNLLQHAVDVPRLRQGGVNAPCWGVVVFPFHRAGFFNQAIKYLDMVHQWHQDHSGLMNLCMTGTEVQDTLAQGGIGGILGLEGAHPLLGKMENLETLVQRGIRYLTLAHFTSNEAAICATDRKPQFTGLSDFGRDVVSYCDDHNVMIDLAHVSEPSFMEAAAHTRNPVIVSHTGVRAVNDMWRNISDTQIRAVADSGGVIGVILHSNFLGPDRVASVNRWVDHVDHIVKLVGPDHAAIGSDLDGAIVPPREMQDIADMPQLTWALVQRGYTHEDIRKILGANALRVFKQVMG